jgi:hypothetical protein
LHEWVVSWVNAGGQGCRAPPELRGWGFKVSPVLPGYGEMTDGLLFIRFYTDGLQWKTEEAWFD